RADGALLARRRAGVGRQHARARSRGHAGVAVRLAVAAAHRSVLLGAPFRTRLTGRARVGRAAVLPWFIGAVLVLAARVAQAGTAALDVHAPDQGAGPAPLLRAEAGVAAVLGVLGLTRLALRTGRLCLAFVLRVEGLEACGHLARRGKEAASAGLLGEAVDHDRAARHAVGERERLGTFHRRSGVTPALGAGPLALLGARAGVTAVLGRSHAAGLVA